MDHEYSFTASELACSKIADALDKRGTPGSYLRVGVRGSGCSGYAYHIEIWDKDPRDKDLIFKFDKVKILIDKKSIIYLNNAELDWEKKLLEQGFKINNPNVTNSCGCQKSFSV